VRPIVTKIVATDYRNLQVDALVSFITAIETGK
jgi:hypothetical protein